MTSTKPSTHPKTGKWIIVFGVAAALSAAAFFFKSRLHSSPLEISSYDSTLEDTDPSSPLPSPANALPRAPQTEPGSTPSAAPMVFSPKTQALLGLLTEILNSRNDNDPRLDQDFRNLSPEAKAALRMKYQQLPSEDRNGRGTIAFLIGREILASLTSLTSLTSNDLSDLGFLKAILNEAPCFSLADCKRESKEANGADAHHEVSTEVTLAYPQLTALYWLDRLLSAPSSPENNPSLIEEARKIVEDAKNSPIPAVSRKAQEIQKRFKKP